MSRLRKAALTLAVALVVALGIGASDSNVRFNALGHRLMCPCGCNQILLECNHVGCPDSDHMRAELAAAMERDGRDGNVLQGFVQKYGATVLAAPTAVVAWVMPFAALVLAAGLVIVFARRMRVAAPTGADSLTSAQGGQMWGASAQEVEALRQRARAETEL